MSKEYTEITTHAGGDDHELFQGIVNRRIDSHLEGFTRSRFSPTDSGCRWRFRFHVSEMALLKRRLSEVGTEHADMWGVDIFGDAYFRA